MNIINTVLPYISSIVSLVFAALVLKRYVDRRGTHLLLWGIGMLLFSAGALCEALFGLLGWNEWIYRIWYLVGAILVAAWLGQGTVYLLAKRRWANVLMVLLGLGSLYAAYRVFTAQLDPALLTTGLHTGTELSGHAIVTPGVRMLTPIFNSYGTLMLVGGATYSAWIFWRKRILLQRTIGNVLIAAGALLPAFGGTFSRFGIPGALYVGELLGAILMFLGFLRATRPSEDTSKQAATRAQGLQTAEEFPLPPS